MVLLERLHVSSHNNNRVSQAISSSASLSVSHSTQQLTAEKQGRIPTPPKACYTYAYLAEVMEALLGGEGDEHDYGADRRHNSCRCELQHHSLVSLRHCPFGRPPVLDLAFLPRLAESNLCTGEEGAMRTCVLTPALWP
jgi:hypothetical protein